MSVYQYEYEPEAYNFDYEPGEDWPEYDPERPQSRPRPPRPPYSPPVPRPPARPPQYSSAPTAPGTVTRAELTRALQRVAVDIDRLKGGVRATTGQINDLSDRTGRALRNVQTSQTQQGARLEREVAGAKELGVLGAVLSGGGGNTGLLLLLLLASESPGTIATPGPDGQQPAGTGGLLGGGGSSGLVLALALSGALNPNP
jgi:hypothetical protein